MKDSDSTGQRQPFSIRRMKLDIGRKRGGGFEDLTNLEYLGIKISNDGHEILKVRRFGSMDNPVSVHLRLVFGIRSHDSTNFIEVN